VVYPQPVTPAQPTVIITQPSCTEPNAIIVLTSSNTGLVYSINNGADYVTFSRFSGLVPGTYWPKVKNGAGCASTFMVRTINPRPPIPAAPALTVTQPTCTVATGTISISSPSDTLSYSINNTTYQPGGNFSGMASGSYPVTAENSAGCISPSSMASILLPTAAPEAPSVTLTQPTCTVATGTITISSPVDSFSYSINNVNYQPGGSFSGLTTGSYPVTAENSAGCISSPSMAVILTTPAPLPTPGVTVVQPTCSVTTGSIDISGPLGPGLMYSVNGTTYQPDTSFTSLAMGSYPVTAKDNAGCVSSPASAVILAQPASCNVVIGVYPNPYVGEVNFTIVSPQSGKGLLVFYNLWGQLMNPLIETDLVAGLPTSINCPMGFAHKQAVVYQLTIGKKKMQGILLPQKY
jgi:hypothetical protein